MTKPNFAITKPKATGMNNEEGGGEREIGKEEEPQTNKKTDVILLMKMLF